MLYQKIHLNEYYDLNSDPTLEAIIMDNFDVKTPKRRGLIVVPGGAYVFVSKREGDPIAIRFASYNYSTFVLRYTVDSEHKGLSYPTQVLELMAAIDYIKKHADEFMVDKNQIAAIGFSAGGHLVALTAYKYKEKELLSKLKIKEGDAKLNAVVLAYPVISLLKYPHQETARVITNGDEKLLKELSIENHIESDYPPTFIWTTEDDNGVSSKNTYVMDDALTKANVKHKTIVYEHGEHGLSLSDDTTNENGNQYSKYVINWPIEVDKFLKETLN